MTSSASADATAEIDGAIQRIRAGYLPRFRAASTEQALRDENAKILGKKGELTAILSGLGKAPPESRKAIGEKVNALRQEVEVGFQTALGELRARARQVELEAPPFDLTLPARVPAGRGHRHPITAVREDVVAVFRSLGFAVFDGPDIEHEENNFSMLGFPPDHPATDMQDSFWTKGGHLLRTHTSNIQVRAMLAQKPPMAFIAPGTVYRRDDDATHSPMFTQIEGLCVDEHISFADLKGVLMHFVKRFFQRELAIRLRPSYFPFVEPGAEIDMQCSFCMGRERTCRLCKGTGWIEIGGSGMVDPEVFANVSIDSEKYTGFAFGMGLERMAMLRHNVTDIKFYYEGDVRFLEQF